MPASAITRDSTFSGQSGSARAGAPIKDAAVRADVGGDDLRFRAVSRRVSWAAFACAAILIASGCGDEPDEQIADTARTTLDTTSTTTTQMAGAEGPDVSQRALDFLDCDTLSPPQGDIWGWVCFRSRGMALITDAEYTVREFVDLVRSGTMYNPESSLLFQTPGGYVFVRGYEGFEHVHTTVGELPDLYLIDTDEFPPSPPPSYSEPCNTDPCHG